MPPSTFHRIALATSRTLNAIMASAQPSGALGHLALAFQTAEKWKSLQRKWHTEPESFDAATEKPTTLSDSHLFDPIPKRATRRTVRKISAAPAAAIKQSTTQQNSSCTPKPSNTTTPNNSSGNASVDKKKDDDSDSDTNNPSKPPKMPEIPRTLPYFLGGGPFV